MKGMKVRGAFALANAAASRAAGWGERLKSSLALCCLLLVTCCQPLPSVPHALPPPPPDSPGRYQLQVGDQFDVRFFGNPELNESITVQPDGRFSLLFARDIQGAGRTVTEIADELGVIYQKELVDPKVTVILRATIPNRFYVGGEVNAPGEYLSIGPPLTVVQAIARAGGLRNSANPDQLILARRNGKGPPHLYAISFNNATTGVAPEEDVILQSYDSLFVPRTPIANAYLAFQQYFQQFVPDTFSYGISRAPGAAAVF